MEQANDDDVIKENIREHNSNLPEIFDYAYRTSIVGGSRSGKVNSLFNLINQQPDTDKIYLYAKDLYETKYKFLINKQESTSLKYFNDFKAFVEYSNNMNNIYKNIEECNPNKKLKILIVFNDMIAYIHNNEKLNKMNIVNRLSK